MSKGGGACWAVSCKANPVIAIPRRRANEKPPSLPIRGANRPPPQVGRWGVIAAFNGAIPARLFTSPLVGEVVRTEGSGGRGGVILWNEAMITPGYSGYECARAGIAGEGDPGPRPDSRDDHRPEKVSACGAADWRQDSILGSPSEGRASSPIPIRSLGRTPRVPSLRRVAVSVFDWLSPAVGRARNPGGPD